MSSNLLIHQSAFVFRHFGCQDYTFITPDTQTDDLKETKRNSSGIIQTANGKLKKKKKAAANITKMLTKKRKEAISPQFGKVKGTLIKGYKLINIFTGADRHFYTQRKKRVFENHDQLDS